MPEIALALYWLTKLQSLLLNSKNIYLASGITINTYHGE